MEVLIHKEEATLLTSGTSESIWKIRMFITLKQNTRRSMNTTFFLGELDSLFIGLDQVKIQSWSVGHSQTTNKSRWSWQFQKRSVKMWPSFWKESAHLAQGSLLWLLKEHVITVTQINTLKKTQRTTSTVSAYSVLLEQLEVTVSSVFHVQEATSGKKEVLVNSVIQMQFAQSELN